MFKTSQEALQYLKQCKKIIIPSKFTYLCHSGQLQTDDSFENNAKYKKLWEAIPSEGFVVKGEMSFLSQRDRLQYVAEHRTFDAAPTDYAGVEGQENFQIKVVFPKQNLTKDEYADLGKDDSEINKLGYIHRGLGDGRHPKLPGKTKVHVFGFMNHDEMSGKEIKTIIGVRDEDLVAYANEVQREIAQSAENGRVVDSSYEMPDNDVGIILKKEIFVMGDNLFKKEFAKEDISADQHGPQSEIVEKTSYDLKVLEARLAKEHSAWVSSGDLLENRYSDIDKTRTKRRATRPTIGGFTSIRVIDGHFQVDKCNNSNAQLRLYKMAVSACEDLAKHIDGELNSKYGNYLQYAINDFCDLEIIDSLLPEIKNRYNDLTIYEKFVGKFEDSILENKSFKKTGILGLLGMKENRAIRRGLTAEEMGTRKKDDITRLNIALAEGKIEDEDYQKAIEAIEHLYEGYVDKVVENKQASEGNKNKHDAFYLQIKPSENQQEIYPIDHEDEME